MKHLALFALLAVSPALAAEPSAPVAPAEAMLPVALDQPIITAHRGTFAGRKIEYSAIIERFDTQTAEGKASARLVAISYVAKKGPPDRPVLFIFNGGPIVSSSTLHMGAFGPKRVAVPDDIQAKAGAIRLVDNPHAPLDAADLVFFDPAGTGFSRFAPGTDPLSQASNVADSRQLAQMILQWRERHGRKAAPIFLVGESYGTMRAPEAARQLLEAGVAVDGLVLLGQAVNIIEYAQRPANLTSYVVSLPTLAATAWEHDRAARKGRTFDAFIADARAFAIEEYLPALYLGGTAADARRRAVATKLEEYTGLPAEWYLANKLRISKTDYQKALFPGYELDTYDARYKAAAGADSPFTAVLTAYQKHFNAYLIDDLQAARVGAYLSDHDFPGGLNGWDWGENKSPFGNWPYQRPISELLAKNPRFRMLVANGWTDTQTTVGAMELLVNEAGWPADRVTTRTYRGGHMPYSITDSLKLISDDVRALITRPGTEPALGPIPSPS